MMTITLFGIIQSSLNLIKQKRKKRKVAWDAVKNTEVSFNEIIEKCEKIYMKFTKKMESDLIQFNRLRKKIGEPKMNEQEYLNYIYGKTKIIQKKGKLKASSIPVWANDHSNIKSVTSDHIADKPNQDYKKEVSSKYTISIPFNKGAYSVIPVSEIHCIGRKW